MAQGPEQRLGIAQAQPVTDRFPLPAYGAAFSEVDFKRQHVGRQNPVGLEQADEQGNGHHQRDDLHEFSQDARQQHQRQKGGNSGHHRGGNGGEYFPERIDNGSHGLRAPLQAIVNGLDHHHGVVDDHTQDDHDGKQHGIVQGKTTGIEYQKSAGKCERNTDGGQKGDPCSQEQPGDQQDQEQADERVGLHNRQRLAGTYGLVVRQDKLYAGCVLETVPVIEVFVQDIHQFQYVGIRVLGDRQEHGGFAFISDHLRRLFPGAGQFRDGAEGHHAGSGNDGEIPQG